MTADMSLLTLLKKQFTPSKMVFHTLFWAAHWAIFAYGWWKQASDPRLAGLNTLKHSVWISRGAGLVLSVDGMLLLLPVCRTTMRFVRPKITFIPLDENIWMHRQLAYATLLFTVIHTAAHYVK
jgi:NADPH oxidase 1